VTALIILLVAVALGFDFLNGLHDAANSIATIVSTGAMSPRWAIVWAAFFNFIAFLFFGVHVAATVGNLMAGRLVDRFESRNIINAMLWLAIINFCALPCTSAHAFSAAVALTIWGICGWGLIVPQQHRGSSVPTTTAGRRRRQPRTPETFSVTERAVSSGSSQSRTAQTDR